MKKDELNINEFIKRCMFDRICRPELTDLFEHLLEEAKDSDDFIIKVLTSDKGIINGSQAYAELSKTKFGHKKRVQKMLASDKEAITITTVSDAGTVKIGNGTNSISIPNGQGDGETTVVLMKNKITNKSMLNYFAEINGSWGLYNYDCDSTPIKPGTIEGKYAVYFSDGIVVFEPLT